MKLNSNKIAIKVIAEKRSDAINVYNESLISRLVHEDAYVNVILFNNTWFNNRILNFISEIVNTTRILFIVQRNDIVLFTDPLSLNMVTSLFLKNKKYVLFFHYEKDPFFYKFLPFFSYRKILNRFDGIICSSEFSISELRLLGVNTTKCKIIYCGLDHNLFKPSQIKPYPFEYILSIGSEEPRKNMENILKAFRILTEDFPDLKLLKVGKANSKNREHTMYQVERLQLTESVVFANHVENEKLPQIYSAAKLLLFPSLKEGFGFPLIEAMACGCPIVTSNRSPMAEIVGYGQTTVDPLRPDDIASACKKILSDSIYRESKVHNGLQRAKYFNWEKTSKEIYSFMKDC